MKTVKVTYTVKPEFVVKNQENINAFMQDFRQLPSAGFRYTVYLLADGRTFLHLSSYADDAIQKQVLNVESFKSFQRQRDESGLDGSHRVEELKLVASSYDTLA
jgi:hypothetical protein